MGGILKIKQRCCNTRFCTVKFIDLINIPRDQFSINHIDGVLNDDELLLLYDLNWLNNLNLPYDSYPVFNFNDFEDVECLSEFRFHKCNLPLLADVLRIPKSVVDWRLFVFCLRDIAILADTPTW